MIILHSGVSKESGATVIGYAVRENGDCYIKLENGSNVKVEPETVLPYKTFHHIEDHVNFAEQIIQEFHTKGAYYLEDLARWSDAELQQIQGVGRVRRDYIRKVIRDTLD